MAMVDQADLLVLLDTVDVNRQSWQTRAPIRTRAGATVLLSVPVHAHMGQPIREVQIVNGRPWRKKHWATIEQAYSKTPGWDILAADFHRLYHGNDRWHADLYLADLNYVFIKIICEMLGITTRIVPGYRLGPTRDGKVERLEDLLAATGATSYLASRGSTYLEGQSHIGDTPIEWFDYVHPVYEQAGHDVFVSHLSVVDLIANCGTDSLAVLRG